MIKVGFHTAIWLRDGHLESFARALDEISETGWIVDDSDYTSYAAVESSAICRRYLGEALSLKGRRGWWPVDPLARAR